MTEDLQIAGQVVDGVCVQAIVGTAEWATEMLGGEWHDADQHIGIGWRWTHSGWQPPAD